MKVNGQEEGSTNRAPARKLRTPKRVAGWALLIACVSAGVLSLAAPQTSYSLPGNTQTPTGGAIFNDDFETGDLSKWSSSTGLVAQQVHVFAGSWAAESTATGGTGGFAVEDLAQSQTNLYYETHFDILSQSTNVNLLRFRNNLIGHNALATLFVSSGGKLGLRNDVAAVQTTSAATTVTPNAWHTALVHVTINGTSSSTEVWLDGAPIADLSLANIDLGTNPVGRLELGDNGLTGTYDVAFDDVRVPDSAAPTAPGNLHTTSVTSTEIDLAWDAASDDFGVTGYQIFRDGSLTPIASVGPTTSYQDTGLAAGTTYSYTVKALDAAGNVSPASAAAIATTSRLDQTITFGALPNRTFGNPDFSVTATASSGLPVSFTASGSCTVSGSKVHLTGPGSCTVTASQPGNASYNPAPGVSRAFSIANAPSPPPPPPPPPPATRCKVPNVVHTKLGAAKSMIKRRHCRTGKVSYAYSRKMKKGIVISQSRRPGRVLRVNSKINLVVSRGRKH